MRTALTLDEFPVQVDIYSQYFVDINAGMASSTRRPEHTAPPEIVSVWGFYRV